MDLLHEVGRESDDLVAEALRGDDGWWYDDETCKGYEMVWFVG